VHEEPDALRITRPKVRQHLSFGAGIHRCVGDRLAELQLQILWREMLKRNLQPEITGDPVRAYSNFLRGIRFLPVIIRA
jgi:cytochrome P450